MIRRQLDIVHVVACPVIILVQIAHTPNPDPLDNNRFGPCYRIQIDDFALRAIGCENFLLKLGNTSDELLDRQMPAIVH